MSDVDDRSERDFADEFPDDLPPVQPPSAGFILQLFVVPGLIVLAVVAVWGLFGRMAATEQDWRSLVVELQHSNPNRKWRGAHGLAQVLQADQKLGAEGERLAQSSELAGTLSKVLRDELQRGGTSDDDLKSQAFLARTLGLFEVLDDVLPALEESIDARYDREVRKNGLGSIAVIAGRELERAHPLRNPDLLKKVVAVSADADPLMRQLSAFTLGLLPEPSATRRLREMVADPDFSTRINAALALARQQDTHGFPVLVEVLRSTGRPDGESGPLQLEQHLGMKNSLTCVARLAREFTQEQRHQLDELIRPIAADDPDILLRQAALEALKGLEAAR